MGSSEQAAAFSRAGRYRAEQATHSAAGLPLDERAELAYYQVFSAISRAHIFAALSSSTVAITTDDPRSLEAAVLSKWRLGDLPLVLGESGPVVTTLSQQWVISIYTEWEDQYQARITQAVDAPEPINIPVMGDMRHFRNDIVHHRGVATKQNTGRCEVLSHWFEPGDPLYFDTSKVAEFMGHLQLSEKVTHLGWIDPEPIRRPPPPG